MQPLELGKHISKETVRNGAYTRRTNQSSTICVIVILIFVILYMCFIQCYSFAFILCI